MMSPYTSMTGIMVTGKNEARIKLAHRAVRCWQQQAYLGTRELLIINDHPTLAVYPDGAPNGIREERIPERLSLGALRNIGIERATHDYLVQWDDDDISHPRRLIWQVEHTHDGMATTFCFEIHYDSDTGEVFVNDGSSIRGGCGFPGTMMWPKTMLGRFLEIEKREDSEFIEQIKHQQRLTVLNNDPVLYCRIFHGDNTWNQTHVMHRKPGWRELSKIEQEYMQQIKQWLDNGNASPI